MSVAYELFHRYDVMCWKLLKIANTLIDEIELRSCADRNAS
jgi:hypothetical protein